MKMCSKVTHYTLHAWLCYLIIYHYLGKVWARVFFLFFLTRGVYMQSAYLSKYICLGQIFLKLKVIFVPFVHFAYLRCLRELVYSFQVLCNLIFVD